MLSSFSIVQGAQNIIVVVFSTQMQSQSHAFRLLVGHLRPGLVRMHAEDTIKSRYSCGACGFSVQKDVVSFRCMQSCWKVQLR